MASCDAGKRANMATKRNAAHGLAAYENRRLA
jgi:hypothetical protein